MCLGIPGQIIQVADSALQLAVVDVCGVKREVNISLICQDDPKPLVGKWVLVHVGFAMTIIDEEEAKQTQEASNRLARSNRCNGLYHSGK